MEYLDAIERQRKQMGDEERSREKEDETIYYSRANRTN